MLLQEGERLRFQIEPGLNPVFAHALGRRWPDPVEFLDRQGFDKAWPILRRDDGLAARSLLYEMPAEALSPVTCLILARISRAISVAISMPFRFSVTSR